MSESTSTPVVFHADAEHSGLRTAVVAILAVVIPIFYLLINVLWPLIAPEPLIDFSFVITCTSSIILGVAAVWGIEKGLKQVWHSGRVLTLDESGITVVDESLNYQLNWDGHLNLLYWKFVLHGYKRGGRERRIPDKWVCFACQLQESDHRIVVYTFMAPKNADRFEEEHGRDLFHSINPAEVFSNAIKSNFFSAPSRPDKIPNEYLTGKDGSYWLAEQTRWREGFELSAQEFEIFLTTMARQSVSK